MTLTTVTKTGLHELALDHVFTIGASGSSAYTFQGEGLSGTVSNPTLYLTRGKTYRFENGSGGHPIRIQSTSGASGTAYNTGVTNNAGSGTVIVEVQHDAPDVLYYQCTSHAAMNGILYITGALADGNVTTAKIADDAVNNDKLANSVVATIAANTAKTTNQTHTGDVTGSTALTIANNAVTTAKIADQAVTLAKLPHGTSSNNGKFLRANNGADPTFETVNTDLVGDTSPQLGGNLDTNGNAVKFADNIQANFGTGDDSAVRFNGTDLVITTSGKIKSYAGDTGFEFYSNDNSDTFAKFIKDGAIELYHDNVKKFETGQNYSVVTGIANGNPAGLKITNSDANSNYSHAELRLMSKNGASYGVIYNDHANSNVRIGHNTTGNTLEVYNDGDIRVQGIRFGSDTAVANTIDDYEEGTWTSTVYWSSSNTTGGYTNTTSQSGSYTKIGNTVFVTLGLYPATYNSGSNCWIVRASLPFAPNAQAACAFAPYSGRGNYGGTLSNTDFNTPYAQFSTGNGGTIVPLMTGNGQGAGYWGHYSGTTNASAIVSGTYTTT